MLAADRDRPQILIKLTVVTHQICKSWVIITFPSPHPIYWSLIPAGGLPTSALWMWLRILWLASIIQCDKYLAGASIGQYDVCVRENTAGRRRAESQTSSSFSRYRKDFLFWFGCQPKIDAYCRDCLARKAQPRLEGTPCRWLSSRCNSLSWKTSISFAAVLTLFANGVSSVLLEMWVSNRCYQCQPPLPVQVYPVSCNY